MHYFISRLAAVIMALGIPAAQGVVVFQESFEGAPHYSVQNGGYLDSANGDRFFTTLPGPGLTLGYAISNIDGAKYFAARDLDGFGTTGPHTVTFATQDVSAYQHLSVVIALSARAGGLFDTDDAIIMEYSSDGGAHYTELDRFTGNKPSADLSNGSSVLTQSLVDYSYALPDLTQLNFRITADAFLANDEIVAFDNFRLLGDVRPAALAIAAVDEPSSLILLQAGLVSGAVLNKLRRARRRTVAAGAHDVKERC